MKKIVCILCAVGSLLNASSISVYAASSLDIVISEIGWSGTVASTSDEWIELYNNTPSSIDLNGWTLVSLDGTPNIALSGTIAPHAYFLLERTDDNTISNITADILYTGSLKDSGETLQLKDSEGTVIDSANNDGGSWPAGTDGSGTPARASMERLNLASADNDNNWVTNDGVTKNGLDKDGNTINGTPKEANSTGLMTPTPTPTPTPTLVTSTPTPTPTLTSTTPTLSSTVTLAPTSDLVSSAPTTSPTQSNKALSSKTVETATLVPTETELADTLTDSSDRLVLGIQDKQFTATPTSESTKVAIKNGNKKGIWVNILPFGLVGVGFIFLLGSGFLFWKEQKSAKIKTNEKK